METQQPTLRELEVKYGVGVPMGFRHLFKWSKYTRHQGNKECARRLTQMAKRGGKIAAATTGTE